MTKCSKCHAPVKDLPAHIRAVHPRWAAFLDRSLPPPPRDLHRPTLRKLTKEMLQNLEKNLRRIPHIAVNNQAPHWAIRMAMQRWLAVKKELDRR